MEDPAMAMATAKEHIEQIRKKKFSIGSGKNPLRKDLRMAVKYLSTELYSKDVHFLMELIQNAEDNEYPEGVEPSLEFMITSQDITATGAPATLLIFNNEKGFFHKNIDSICSVGDSTKAGNRKRGYIGEKGIGFKSVFLLTTQPYIFSNGYQIRFNETPCPECDIAYIVPEWVDNKPSDIHKMYGHGKILPNTTIILPLKHDKVKSVKEQLSSLHPELLLFLLKIKRLSVKEDKMDPSVNTMRSISISSEIDFAAKKNIGAESFTVHLTSEEDGDYMEGECRYYMWKQRFPVKKENKVEKRMDIEEWTITLAFPYGNRLNRGMSSPGIYAFLPTETVTNFPFIIQADFLLPSSRETILWDDIWNQGILDCVPNAFINAFVSLVRTREDAPASSLAPMFRFLPINPSCHPKLNAIREAIRVRLLEENIIPSESHLKQKFFHKPSEVGRLMPGFWSVLMKAKNQGVKLYNLSSQGMHVLNSSFDTREYENVLNFLGIEYVGLDWYPKCIQSCNLVMGVREDVYLDLLFFLAENWETHFARTSMVSLPLLKYVGASGNISLISINEATGIQYTLCTSLDKRYVSWLINWSKEFRFASQLFFLPESTQELFSGVETLNVWLRYFVNVKTLSVYQYASSIQESLKDNRLLVLAYAHFLYLSYSKEFLNPSEAEELCRVMPVLNAYGDVLLGPKAVLVPANGSNWVELLGSNPWRNEGYVELADEYMDSGRYAGQNVPKKALINFLESFAVASDIPDICPPDAAFATVSSPLTKQNAFLLLDWINRLKSKGTDIPNSFLNCVKHGSWLKVTVSGCRSYKPPSQSFLPGSSWGSLLQSGSDMVDIPLVDEGFYDNRIRQYEEELKAIGVISESGQACEFIANHLMYLAANYNLTQTKVVAMLNFIRFLRDKYLPVDEFINNIKNVEWVRTSFGERSPVKSVLYGQGWKDAMAISQIPFLDQDYYGNDILEYKTELKVLGVTVGFDGNYQIVIDNLKPSLSLNYLSAEPLIFALECIRNCCSSGKLTAALKDAKCLRTNVGYLSPGGCFLYDPQWGCILEVLEGFPYVDNDFYGSKIFEYKYELSKLGVVVNFDDTSQSFSNEFRQRAGSNSITKENVLSFLAALRKLRKAHCVIPDELHACIREAKWLRTRLGDYRPPTDCILYSSDWQPISLITLLPFIDVSDSCYGKVINDYNHELESMGVVVDFKKKDADLVLSCVFFPHDPADIIPCSIISLLQCIKNSKPGVENPLPEPFLQQIHQRKWLKTTLGYMSPKECLLFDRNHSLHPVDGPFLDDEHYGQPLYSFKNELATIGVTVDLTTSNANLLLVSHMRSHSEFARIERIYHFLQRAGWKPENQPHAEIWIPSSSTKGMWVSPRECRLHDDEGLFSSRIHVLDQIYKNELLLLFSTAFGVKGKPSIDDYCRLWKDWENSKPVLSHEECCAFWGSVIRNWSKNTEKMISETVTKIPAVSSQSSEILLINKQDVFLPDDLLLRDLFEKSSPHKLFVWFPVRNLPSISPAKLFDIYAKIGVRKISESVYISDHSELKCGKFKQVNPKDGYIVKGLVMLILGVLADPALNIEVKRRHETVKACLNVRVFEMDKPIMMSYILNTTASNVIEVTTSQLVRWERESSEFFLQKLDKQGGYKNVVEYATKFADMVSSGMLWEKEDQIPRLSELIKFGFLMEFDEDAVRYFMKSKNLQMFAEDEEFLASVFSSS